MFDVQSGVLALLQQLHLPAVGLRPALVVQVLLLLDEPPGYIRVHHRLRLALEELELELHLLVPQDLLL